MRSMWKCLAVLALGCAGEPFTEFSDNEITVGGAGLSNGGSEQFEGAGNPGTSGRRTTNQGGEFSESISGSETGGSRTMAGNSGLQMPEMPGGNGGDGGNGDEPSVIEPSAWLCRIDGNVCQCYSDPSVFEPGWLNVTDCPASNRCTSRDATACVCWDTDSSYTSALMNGFKAEKECPNAE